MSEALWRVETATAYDGAVMRLSSPRLSQDFVFHLDPTCTVTILSSCCAGRPQRTGRAGELLDCSECGQRMTGFTLEHSAPHSDRFSSAGLAAGILSCLEVLTEPLTAAVIASELTEALRENVGSGEGQETLYSRVASGLTSATVIA